MSNRSFKKMLKRRGPSMGPCGTPIIEVLNEERMKKVFC